MRFDFSVERRDADPELLRSHPHISAVAFQRVADLFSLDDLQQPDWPVVVSRRLADLAVNNVSWEILNLHPLPV
jgi:hypothetical protein